MEKYNRFKICGRRSGGSRQDRKMQKMMDSLSETCNVYGIEINVRKTKVMIVGDTGATKGVQHDIVLDGMPLEQVSRFKYLGSWITKNARCEEDIRA